MRWSKLTSEEWAFARNLYGKVPDAEIARRLWSEFGVALSDSRISRDRNAQGVKAYGPSRRAKKKTKLRPWHQNATIQKAFDKTWEIEKLLQSWSRSPELDDLLTEIQQ